MFFSARMIKFNPFFFNAVFTSMLTHTLSPSHLPERGYKSCCAIEMSNTEPFVMAKFTTCFHELMRFSTPQINAVRMPNLNHRKDPSRFPCKRHPPRQINQSMTRRSVSFGTTIVRKIWFHWSEKYSTHRIDASREPYSIGSPPKVRNTVMKPAFHAGQNGPKRLLQDLY
jgi:hypothetical protein